jgi:predicted Zn-dependent protease
MALGAAAQYGEAFQLASELLRGDPGSAELNALAGDALLNSQKAEESIPFLKKSAAANRGNLVTQRSLGLAYLKSGDAKLALPHLEAAVAIDADGSVYYQLGIAYRQTGQAELAKRAQAKYHELSTKAAPPPEPEITAP